MLKIEELVKFIDEKQGQDITVLDMRKVTYVMDFMIVTHVSNPRLLNALSEYVTVFLDQKGQSFRPLDKKSESGWILIDAHDIIIHLFLKEDRELYQLEKLWKDTIVDHESISSL